MDSHLVTLYTRCTTRMLCEEFNTDKVHTFIYKQPTKKIFQNADFF